MKKQDRKNPFRSIDKILHEPNRTAIMSVLCSSHGGIAFSELKNECNLTDGNLSRHLRTLEDASMITIEKKFVGVKPRTTIYITDHGRAHFISYLKNLEEVLKAAAGAVAKDSHGELGLDTVSKSILPSMG